MESSTPLAENFERNRSNPPPKRYRHKRRRYEIDMLYILLYPVAYKPYSPAFDSLLHDDNDENRPNFVYITHNVEFFMFLVRQQTHIHTYTFNNTSTNPQ